MVIRSFKTLIIIFICFGLCFKTNAAVSVSDGSAFVTNAEFNADVNNLENRMASLENSLDAKIDSLVSSYLTRNGIWNGAKQELTDVVKDGNAYDFIPNFTTGDRGSLSETKVRFSDVIVAKTTKAGMAFGAFAYGNKHQGSPNNWYYGLYSTGVTSGWIWDSNLNLTLSFYESDQSVTTATNGTLKSVIEIGKITAIRNWTDMSDGRPILMAIPLPEWNIVPFLFFVEKDKKVWWRWVDECSTYNMQGVSLTTAAGCHMKVGLLEFNIY